MPPEDELDGAGAGAGAGVSTVGVAARELDSLACVAADDDSLDGATGAVREAALGLLAGGGGSRGGGGRSIASSGATETRRTGSAALTRVTGRLGAASLRVALPPRESRAMPKKHAKVAHAASAISGPRTLTRVPSQALQLQRRSTRRSTPTVFTPGTLSVVGSGQRRTRPCATARHVGARRNVCTCRSHQMP